MAAADNNKEENERDLIQPGYRFALSLTETELDRLFSEEREVLFLNCVEGYTAAELGDMLGKPRSAVLNILSRAKKKLAQSHEPTEKPQSDEGSI